MKPVTILQDKDRQVPVEVLAESIKAIAEGVRKLRAGSLNDRALFLLIQNAAPGALSIKDIKAVFTGIDSLEGEYLRKRVKT